jgi:hypothetical protein
MTPDTQLLRQINPSFVQAGRVTSQAFRPTPKDEQQLSVYDGEKIKPEAAWLHFVKNPDCKSDGIMAVTNGECQSEQLLVVADEIPFPEHCYIDFSTFNKKEIERKAKVLSRFAQARGWLFQA